MEQIHEAPTLAEAHLLRGALESRGIAVEVRGEQLTSGEGHRSPVAELRPTVWVAEGDVAQAREILAATSGPAADATSDADGADAAVGDEKAQAAMSEIFLVAGRLRRDPRRGDLHDELRRLRPAVVDSPPPYGIPPPVWDTLGSSAAELLRAAEAGHDETVTQTATDLHALLREYV